MDRVWDGPRTKIAKFDQAHDLVQVGWWLEPEQEFVRITEGSPKITGSASPVYAEVGD